MVAHRTLTAVFCLLLASGANAESMASHEANTGNRPGAADHHGGRDGIPPAPLGAPTDAELEANQAAIDNGTVDTSVDSCAAGCLIPDDVIGSDE